MKRILGGVSRTEMELENLNNRPEQNFQGGVNFGIGEKFIGHY